MKIAIIVFLITNILSFVGGISFQKIKAEINTIDKKRSQIEEVTNNANNNDELHLQSDIVNREKIKN